MKKISILAFCLCLCGMVSAQQVLYLVAEKKSKKRIFDINERVKIKFNPQGNSQIVAGRINSVEQDSIFIRGLRRHSENRITAIAIKDIEKVKKFYVGARTTTGTLAMFGSLAGMAMLIDGFSKDPVFFADISPALGGAAIVAGLLPYTFVTLSEPSFKVKRGVKFYSITKR